MGKGNNHRGAEISWYTSDAFYLYNHSSTPSWRNRQRILLFSLAEHFHELLETGEIFEHDEYCGNLYGTPRAPIEALLAEGTDVIMDVTVPGSLETIVNFPDAISIFLLPPSFSELRRRLTNRGTESADVIEQRMKKAIYEVRQAAKFKYIIVNEDVNQTAKVIHHILDAERHRSEALYWH